MLRLAGNHFSRLSHPSWSSSVVSTHLLFQLPVPTHSSSLSSPLSHTLGLQLPLGVFPPNPQAAFTCSLWVSSFFTSRPPITHKATPSCFTSMFIDHSSLVWHKSHQLRRFPRLKRQSEVPRYAEAHVLGPHSYLPKAGSPPRTGLHWFFSTSTPPPHSSPGQRLQTEDIHSQESTVCRRPDSVVILASWTSGSCTLKLLSRDKRASLEP